MVEVSVYLTSQGYSAATPLPPQQLQQISRVGQAVAVSGLPRVSNVLGAKDGWEADRLPIVR